MGQYYRLGNLSKKQFIHPHKFGDGLKLLEFGASGGGTMLGLAALLAVGNNRGGGDLHSDNPLIGSWAGDKIAIIGDYADEFDSDKDIVGETVGGYKRIYQGIWETEDDNGKVLEPGWTDVSEDVIKVLCEDSYIRDEFLDTAARYEWQDFSWLFTDAEIAGRKKELAAAKEKELAQ